MKTSNNSENNGFNISPSGIKAIKIICISLTVTLCIVFIVMLINDSRDNGTMTNEDNTAATQTQDSSEDSTGNAESRQNEDKSNETSSEDTLNQNTSGEEKTSASDSGSALRPSTNDSVTSPLPQNTDTGDIAINEFGSFSGEYVEDGSNIPVENVAAVRITNRTDRFLEYAQITLMISGKKATFIVSALPPRRSAWVLEANKMTITEAENFEYIDSITSYKDNIISETDKIKLSFNGNLLKAANTTQSTLKNVTVYYRTLHSDGRFLGGITYKVTFGTLPPGESIEKIAGHYKMESSEIVRIDWQE